MAFKPGSDTELRLPQHVAVASRFDGWPLLGCLAAALFVMAGTVLVAVPGIEGIRLLIRLTARSSLLLFCLAFVSSATYRSFPNRHTAWLRRNRRYLGLGFATSHFIHAGGIVAFAAMDSVQFAINSMGSPVPGIIAYAFIAAMAATSFDRTANFIGRRAWQILHTAGMYYLWVSFVIAFGKRIPQMSGYVVPVIILVLALVCRLLPSLLQRMRTAQ
jgi:hypothetical protein